MKEQEITVVYRWTAKPGKAEDLKAIYRAVEKEMLRKWPGADVIIHQDPVELTRKTRQDPD